MPIRKYFVVLLMTALICGAIASVRAQGSIPAELPDLKGRAVTIVDSNDYTPLSFIDTKSGKPVGFEYDAINEICLRLNCKLTYNTGEWPGLLLAVNQG